MKIYGTETTPEEILFALNKPECLCYECTHPGCQVRIVGCPETEDPCWCEKQGYVSNADCTTSPICYDAGFAGCCALVDRTSEAISAVTLSYGQQELYSEFCGYHSPQNWSSGWPCYPGVFTPLTGYFNYPFSPFPIYSSGQCKSLPPWPDTPFLDESCQITQMVVQPAPVGHSGPGTPTVGGGLYSFDSQYVANYLQDSTTSYSIKFPSATPVWKAGYPGALNGNWELWREYIIVNSPVYGSGPYAPPEWYICEIQHVRWRLFVVE